MNRNTRRSARRTPQYKASINPFRRSLLATAVASTLAPSALAQDFEGRTIEEVIVTVNRIEENLQDVAGTVQSFSAQDLERIGIGSEFANLQYGVPGLQIAKQEGKLEIFLRGIGSSDSDFSSDPSIAVHYNGVYLPRPRGIGPLFFDSERVEVNKGPQGTIRGRNATGGTINIISNKPDFEELGGYVQGGIGNFDNQEAEGVLNIPVTDTFAVRLSAWAREHDGLYDNAFDINTSNFETPSAQDDNAYRISLAWNPTDRISTSFQYFKAEVQSTGDPGAFSGRSFSAGETVEDLNDPWEQYFRTEGNFEQDVTTALWQVAYDTDLLGGLTLEYNGSYNELEAYNQNASREWQLGMQYPGARAEADFIASGADPQRNLLVNDTFYQGDYSESQTHEIRAVLTGIDRLQLSAGAFYFDEDFEYFSWDVGNGFCGDSTSFIGDVPWEGDTVSCWQNGLGGENRGDDSNVESYAFYADGTFDISDSLRFFGGIRYTDEKKTQKDSNAQYQFNWSADFFFSQPGINENSDLIIGEKGFRLKEPGDRRIKDYNPGDSGKALFQDGIGSYGLGDNWGRTLDACEEGVDCQVLVTSIFDPNGDRGTIRAENKVEDDYFNWRAGLEYDFSGMPGEVDTMFYGSVSTGTRSGGINRPLILSESRQADVIWDTEDLTVYEVGAKNLFFVNDYAVVLNGALFYYDYEDYVAQVLVDTPNPTPENPDATTQNVLTDNVGDAEILGLELETNIDLPWNLNFNGSLLWLDSEFDGAEITDSRQNDNPVVSVDGNDLPNVSEWNLNMRLTQTIELDWKGLNSFDWTVSALYRDEYYLTAFNNKGYRLEDDGRTTTIPLSEMPAPNNNGALSGVGGDANSRFYWDKVDSFWIFNATAGINFGEDDRFRLSAWIENIDDEPFSTKGFINSSVNIRYLNAPRQYGVRFRANF